MDKRIECWGPRDYRIRFQGSSSAYWYYSVSYETRQAAQNAIDSATYQTELTASERVRALRLATL